MNILVYSPQWQAEQIISPSHGGSFAGDAVLMSSTLHPNYTTADPKLLRTFAAFCSSICCMCYAVLALGQRWGTVMKEWGSNQDRAFLHLSRAVSLSPCRPQRNTTASRGRSCLVAHFTRWRLGLIACMQDQEPETPCVYKTDCSPKSFTSLEQFTSPFYLSFPVCKSEIMFAFLPGIS